MRFDVTGESTKSRAHRAAKRVNPLAKLKLLPAALKEMEALLSQGLYQSQLATYKGVSTSQNTNEEQVNLHFHIHYSLQFPFHFLELMCCPYCSCSVENFVSELSRDSVLQQCVLQGIQNSCHNSVATSSLWFWCYLTREKIRLPSEHVMNHKQNHLDMHAMGQPQTSSTSGSTLHT